jgi:hypothetical protein
MQRTRSSSGALRSQRFGWREFAWIAGLVGTVGVLYGSVVRLWWTFDDTMLLRVGDSNSVGEMLFAPGFWRLLHSGMFNPLLPLEFKADIGLFGFRPGRFYAHHLAVLAAAVAVLFVNLRLRLTRAEAGFASALFLLGLPVGSWARQLACRHYIEGFVLAGLSALLYGLYRPQRGRWLRIFSSVTYVLAILAKEIYLPLPALLFVLGSGGVGARLRALKLHLAVLVGYLGWRLLMLGTTVGGYGWSIRAQEIPGLLLRLPVQAASLLLPSSTAVAFALALSLGGLASVVFVLRARRRVATLVLAVVILGPMLAVSKALEARVAGLLWLLLCILGIEGWRLLQDGARPIRIAGHCALGIVVAAAVISNRLEWRRSYAIAERMSVEGRSLMQMRPGEFLRRPAVPPAAMKQTAWLRERLGYGPGPGWFSDDVYLCLNPLPGRIWEYDETLGSVAQVSTLQVAGIVKSCEGIRWAAPLAAHFDVSGGALRWKLGPYADGRYALVLDRGIEFYPVRRNDGYQMRPDEFSVMLRYDSPEGWVTYSPPLAMDFRSVPAFDWKRPAGSASRPTSNPLSEPAGRPL